MINEKAKQMKFKKLSMAISIILISGMKAFTNSYSVSPIHASFKLAKKLSIIGNIDDSHNYKHSKEVLFWSIEIMERLPYRLSSPEISMVAECSILHDFMDSKYTDFSKEIKTHLLAQHSQKNTEVMMNIMNTMSYSKIVSPDTQQVCYPDWITMSPFKHVFHIVREADLLSSYNLARMGKLIERNLFVHPSTRKLAECLAEVSSMKLSLLDRVNLRGDLDILRHVNYLSIDNLVDRIDELEPMNVKYDYDGFEWE
jgi:hypothetical protein